MIGYSDKAIRPLILIMPKMSGYVKTFKVKDGDNNNNKLISFCIDDEKLLEKSENFWNKSEDLKILNEIFYKSMMIEYKNQSHIKL